MCVCVCVSVCVSVCASSYSIFLAHGTTRRARAHWLTATPYILKFEVVIRFQYLVYIRGRARFRVTCRFFLFFFVLFYIVYYRNVISLNGWGSLLGVVWKAFSIGDLCQGAKKDVKVLEN